MEVRARSALAEIVLSGNRELLFGPMAWARGILAPLLQLAIRQDGPAAGAKRQMRQALPRRITALEKANAELRKEAKGLK